MTENADPAADGEPGTVPDPSLGIPGDVEEAPSEEADEEPGAETTDTNDDQPEETDGDAAT